MNRVANRHSSRTLSSGFTIVELLIVIVVIGILAAITIVAFNGVQGRAHDTAVQTDLAAGAKSLELYKAQFGTYPANATELDSMKASNEYLLKPSRSAYTEIYNYTYCYAPVAGTAFGLVAQSKSGNAYYITNTTGGVRSFASWGSSVTTICPAVGLSSGGLWGRRGDNNTWVSWIN